MSRRLAHERWATLTTRERAVLKRRFSGNSDAEIARDLGITEEEVQAITEQALWKLSQV